MIINIETKEQYLELKSSHKEYFYNKTKAKFICSCCNKECVKSFKALKIPFLCNHCSKSNSHKTDEYKNRYKNSIKEKYGVEHPLQNKDIKNKQENTFKEKYGVKNPFQSNEIKNKIKETNFKNLGVNYPGQSKKCIEKRKNTLFEKTGYYSNLQIPETIEKIKETQRKLYGGIGYASPELREKAEQTNLKLYGNKHPITLYSAKFLYKNLYFDSSWELIYYIWLNDNKIDFEYHPKEHFNYIFNEKIHYYEPDFKINGIFVEIKGDMFFENDKMINPFDRNLDEKMEAKFNCMIENNVKILLYNDIKPYIEYVNMKYGKDYINQFKINRGLK